MAEACSTHREKERCVQGFWCGNLKERDHLEDLGIDARIILKCIFKNLDGAWTRQVAGACECGNETSGSIKCGEFLDWLRNC